MVPEPLAISLREAKPPLVLALDVGTSGLRAFIFDSRARPIRSCIAAVDHAVRTSSTGEASVDADERLRDAATAIDAVLARAGRRAGQIVAVGVSTFWHSLVGVDAHGRPTTRVLTWADTRPRGASAALRSELDEEAVHRRTGCRLHASYLPAKLRYLREAEPDAYARTVWWGSLGEYLFLRLFGERRAGHGMASATGLYDQRRREWDGALVAHLGLGERVLSPIDDAAQAGLRPAFARRWPALAQVPWLPALGDGACSNVGAGAVRRDVAALMLGTSGAIRVCYEGDDPPVVPGGWTYRLDRRRIVAGGALSNAGNVLTWLRRTFPTVDPAVAARRPVGAHELTAIPLLAGDRSPTWNDGARAAVAGIGLGTSGEDIVARVARLWELVTAALPGIDRVIVTGGAALGAPWLMQLCADAIGRAAVMSAAGEGSARGAAITALERVGAIARLDAVPSPLGRAYRPRAASRARLLEEVERQRRLEARMFEIGR
ncbi:MAG: gluconokinase [Candidatus Rokubacteria bacterium]|nr:gluconokinase [Candidatus Rokubacteria bacterium]